VGSRWRRAYVVNRALVVLGAVVAFGFAAASASGSSDFTWAGPPASTNDWSDPGNWQGDMAPSGSVNELIFPALPDSGCPDWANFECYDGSDGVSGLSTNELSIDDATGYLLIGSSGFPTPLGLGAGGLVATTASSVYAAPALALPIVLDAPQTWSIDGGPAGRGVLGVDNVTGSEPLGIDVSNHGILWLGLIDLNTANVAVGNVTVTGADPADTGTAAYRNGAVAAGKDGDTLNSSNGSTITLVDSGLFGHATVGTVTSNGGVITAGFPLGVLYANGEVDQLGTLTVNGSVTLDSASALQFEVAGPGSTAGTDYSQLNATGPVALGGAALDLTGSDANGSCPTVEPGTVETLVTTSGTLSGVLGNAAPGTIVPLDCDWPSPPTVTIDYTATSVTATVTTAGIAPTTPSAPGSGGGGSSSGAAPPASQTPAALGSVATPASVDSHGQQTVTLTNPNDYPITAQIQESAVITAAAKIAKTKTKPKPHRTTVAYAQTTIAAQGKATVKLRLSAAAQAALKRHHRLAVTLRISLGAVGHATTIVTRTTTLR
jgi:hypothetical protein